MGGVHKGTHAHTHAHAHTDSLTHARTHKVGTGASAIDGSDSSLGVSIGSAASSCRTRSSTYLQWLRGGSQGWDAPQQCVPQLSFALFLTGAGMAPVPSDWLGYAAMMRVRPVCAQRNSMGLVVSSVASGARLQTGIGGVSGSRVLWSPTRTPAYSCGQRSTSSLRTTESCNEARGSCNARPYRNA